ncbi:DUF4783 domain-containing protein [Pseudopedobacter beijingensis]|uniref:DUF4783 domain-containing protein n=1 Tax=Pseudopedobacter beijingensis TaxID=1207056 RepID=A0ABW4IFE7_9SPHI
MKKYLSILFLVVVGQTAFADIIDDVAQSFKNGNAKSLAQYFASSIELSMLNQEDVYSSAQAEIIFKDFFQKNTPVSTRVIHKVTSNANYKFGVILLSTSKNNYRISYELKSASGKFLITQVRIEENKE